MGTIGKVKLKKSKEGTPLGIKKLEVAYIGAQTKTSFNSPQAIEKVGEFEVPKPPAPPKPSSSALANAAAAVAAPPPDKTPIQEMNETVGKVNLKQAGKFFNGSCLPKEDFANIKAVSCNAKFMNILNLFD